MQRWPVLPAAVIAGAIMVAVCMATGAARAQEFDHAGLARAALERHIRPAYAALEREASALTQTVEEACAQNRAEQDGTKAIAEGFAGLAAAWGRVAHLRFGPAIADNRYERYLFWPDPRGIGRRQVREALNRKAEDVASAETLAGKSVALQGLSALEVVLYGSRPDGKLTSGLEPFACRYGGAIARNLETIARELVAAWGESGRWAEVWLSPGSDNPVYLSAGETTRELARALLGGLEVLRERHIAAPLGFAARGREARAVLAASGLSMRFITANAEGMRDLFEKGGMAARLAAAERSAVEGIALEFEQILTHARTASSQRRGDLTAPAVRDKLILIGFPLRHVHFEISRLLAQHADLSIGFNAADGD